MKKGLAVLVLSIIGISALGIVVYFGCLVDREGWISLGILLGGTLLVIVVSSTCAWAVKTLRG